MNKRHLTREFFKNDRLAEVSTFGRLLFMGLCLLADKAGRLEDRPKRLKQELIPYDEADADALLGELATHGLLSRYSANGESWLEICDWPRWQQPSYREKASRIPAPKTALADDCAGIDQSLKQHCAMGETALADEPANIDQSCGNDCAMMIPSSDNELCTGENPGRESTFEVMHQNAVQSRTNNNTPKVLKEIKEQKRVTTSSSEVVRYGPEHRRLAERLREKILANKADARVPADLSRWAETMRLIVERDKRTEARIEAVIDWAGQDPFWSGNILSADALRRHFDRLELAMQRGGKSQWGGSMFGDDGDDPISRAAAKLERMGL